ncbi:MAG: N-methyl-L-tryptophan oxidase, partial [Nitrososphaerales archaeon]|nr:N-methyl-L-tryptophan oxidase [Nitrososphaerales archaeon]
MGSAVTYNLASRGLKVLALDRFRLNHEFGSSHGKTRIIRLAYYEDPRYVPLLKRAFASWDELAKKSGARVIKRTGGLMIGRRDGPLVAGVLRSAREHTLPHKFLACRDVEAIFGELRLDEDYSAVYEENAGILFPEQCISSYVALARDSGVTFGFLEQLLGWRRTAESIEIETTKGRYTAEKLVLAAGPWTAQLLPGLIPLTCERQVPFWFESPGDGAFSAEKMPIFMMEEDTNHYFYAIPDVGHGVKVARTHGGSQVSPDQIVRKVTDADLSPVRDFIKRRLPRVNPTPIGSTTCIYTNTPDSHFVVDFHPDDRRVLVVSACSGHGFKFSSV